jgi:N-acetylneuraminic acid mutarotase
VAVTAGEKMYVIGGAVPGPGQPAVHPARPHTSVGTVEEYDPASNTWRPRAQMPTPRNHMVGGAIGGKIYVASGRVGAAFISGGSSNIGVIEAYDPGADAWSQGLARMANARSAGAGGVYNGRLYITGGEYQEPGMMATFRSLEAYDPAANAWQTLQPMPISRHGLAGAVLGNRLHMVSGDVQSAGTGVNVHTESHDAYEFQPERK